MTLMELEEQHVQNLQSASQGHQQIPKWMEFSCWNLTDTFLRMKVEHGIWNIQLHLDNYVKMMVNEFKKEKGNEFKKDNRQC